MNLDRIVAIVSAIVVVTNSTFLSRQKRLSLVYEPGLNWVQMVAGAGIPVDVKGHSITFGPVVRSYYALPNNSTYYTNPSIDVSDRKKRSASRWKLYTLLANILSNYGINDGKACILHAICESASIPFDKKSGLISEIMHIVLTPSLTRQRSEDNEELDFISAEILGKTENCDRIYHECSLKFIHILTNIY